MKKHHLLAVLLAMTAPLVLATPLDAKSATSKKDLKIISIDVEGGAAVLFRTPEGKSLLIDTGWKPGLGGQRTIAGAPPPAVPISADRIADAAAKLGIKKIDYLFMTHYHADHLGGLEALLAKLPVDTFVDHGPNREFLPPNTPPNRLANSTQARYPAWVAAYQGHNHITAQTGQTLDIGSMHVQFVSSDGRIISEPLPGAGQPNPACEGVQRKTNDGGEENNRSLGMVITFGKTRILYLGDLTWNKEIELLCPTNKVGKVDIYFVTGHGMNLSSSPPTVAYDPLVAVMQNGPTKGGDQEVIKMVDTYPSLKGFWRTHYTVRYPELNGDPKYIANLDWLPDLGYSIDLGIAPNGRFTVTNTRNGFSQTYTARAAGTARALE